MSETSSGWRKPGPVCVTIAHRIFGCVRVSPPSTSSRPPGSPLRSGSMRRASTTTATCCRRCGWCCARIACPAWTMRCRRRRRSSVWRRRAALQPPLLPIASARSREAGRRPRNRKMLWGGRRGKVATSSLHLTDGVAAMPQPNDLSRSLVALDQNSTIIAVVELSQSSWLVGGVVPGIERQPRKKLEPSPERLLAVLHRWRDEAVRAGRPITRIALAFEAGRDGFWLARWLDVRGVEAHVIHPSSVAVSREGRRAKTDRLDTELLKRGFLGWLRGERGHCSMARVPTIAEEDAKRPNRERDCL